jgi:hypothetical protein
MSLKVPLESRQVRAAIELHKILGQWSTGDAALKELHESFPDFDKEWKTLLKAVAVNSLYGTNVYDIFNVATHVHRVIGNSDRSTVGPELVDKMAKFWIASKGRTIHFTSFAAKFAHFFIKEEDFPIYDSYAYTMIRHHLGTKNWIKADGTYVEFAANVELLKEMASLDCSCRDLDRYLWLTGLYRKYKRRLAKDKDPEINAEAERLFSSPTKEQRKHLDILTVSLS